MTDSQIIVYVIAWTAAALAITILVIAKRRTRPARYDVRWNTDGGEFTARGLTEKEFETLMERLKSEEQPDA